MVSIKRNPMGLFNFRGLKEWYLNGGWLWLVISIIIVMLIVIAILKPSSQSDANYDIDTDSVAVENDTIDIYGDTISLSQSIEEPITMETTENATGHFNVDATVIEIDAASNMSIKDNVTLTIAYYPSNECFGVTHINGEVWGKSPYGSRYVKVNEVSHYKPLNMFKFSVRRSNNIFFLFNTDRIEIEW